MPNTTASILFQCIIVFMTAYYTIPVYSPCIYWTRDDHMYSSWRMYLNLNIAFDRTYAQYLYLGCCGYRYSNVTEGLKKPILSRDPELL